MMRWWQIFCCGSLFDVDNPFDGGAGNNSFGGAMWQWGGLFDGDNPFSQERNKGNGDKR